MVKRIIESLLLLGILAGALAACGSRKNEVVITRPTNEWGGTEYEAVSYGDGEYNVMDIFVPDTKEALLPLFVMIHGGGFAGGDRRFCSNMYNYFRDRGYVCAAIDYALAQDSNHAAVSDGSVTGSHPQAIIGCKMAVQYLYDHAEEYKIDRDNIIVWGESAGSYMAMMTALSGPDDFVGAERGLPYDFTVKILVDFYGPVQLWACNPGSDGELVPDKGGMNYVGGIMDLNDLTPEEMAEIDPTAYMGRSGVRYIWIQHGDADVTVSCVQAEILRDAALKVLPPENVYFELLPGAAHIDSAFYAEENLEKLNDFLLQAIAQTS